MNCEASHNRTDFNDTDELILVMYDALAMIEPEQLDPLQAANVQSALEKYNAYKEQTND